MSDHRKPSIVDTDRPAVDEIKILAVKCPNPNCTQNLNITNITEGTKIKCPSCGNITWTPSYKKKWWHRGLVFVGGLLLSFAIGVGSSIAATAILDAIQKDKQKVELTNTESPNKQ